MSTKSTLLYGDNFHLYKDLLDDNNIYLEIESTHVEVNYNRTVVPIPLHVWEAIRKIKGIDFELLILDDASLKAKATDFVNRRLEMVKTANNKALVSLFGAATYGSADEPPEEQIQKGFNNLKAQQQHEREVWQAIYIQGTDSNGNLKAQQLHEREVWQAIYKIEEANDPKQE